MVVAKIFEIGVMALALAALVVGGIELLLATLFLMAVQSTFFSPAKYGILPETLPAALLPWANGVLEMSRYAAVILGTVAGGALLAHFSDRPIYMGAVMIVAACIGAISSLRIDSVPSSGSRKRFHVNPWAEIAGIGVGIGAFTAGRVSRNGIELGLVPVGAFGISAILLFVACTAGTYSELAVGVSLVGFFGGLFFLPLNALLQHLAGGGERGQLIATNTF